MKMVPDTIKPDTIKLTPLNIFDGVICGIVYFMTKTLQIAISKATALPDAAQEELGREMLERIDALAELRAAISVAARQIEAGEEEDLDIEAVIREARQQHGKR